MRARVPRRGTKLASNGQQVRLHGRVARGWRSGGTTVGSARRGPCERLRPHPGARAVPHDGRSARTTLDPPATEPLQPATQRQAVGQLRQLTDGLEHRVTDPVAHMLQPPVDDQQSRHHGHYPRSRPPANERCWRMSPLKSIRRKQRISSSSPACDVSPDSASSTRSSWLTRRPNRLSFASSFMAFRWGERISPHSPFKPRREGIFQSRSLTRLALLLITRLEAAGRRGQPPPIRLGLASRSPRPEDDPRRRRRLAGRGLPCRGRGRLGHQ